MSNGIMRAGSLDSTAAPASRGRTGGKGDFPRRR